ncbi:hypothetical protein CL176_10195 [Suicoccus acidiformans]|uniref:Uncharacterized protein n=1 Tax=Suicoccus acidiformans TaxID=2036206 RepID=A0A347WMN0_9LACT|nr:hypothetical protein [Suicoccus acidiformans]AXY26337.1 hypothetical protein CL176_10195 [Suicoccus acidiformans]
MTDFEKYMNQFVEFLDSEKKSILITGLDDDAKVRMVLNGLNERYKNGMIRCSELGRIAEIINGAFHNKHLPSKISGQKVYSVGNMEITFSKYVDSIVRHTIGERFDFVLYFPIETVLFPGKEKYLNQLLNNISHTGSSKIVLLTTNDHKKNLKALRDIADEHIHYDISNDNPELLEVVKSNLGDFEYPLFE